MSQATRSYIVLYINASFVAAGSSLSGFGERKMSTNEKFFFLIKTLWALLEVTLWFLLQNHKSLWLSIVVSASNSQQLSLVTRIISKNHILELLIFTALVLHHGQCL